MYQCKGLRDTILIPQTFSQTRVSTHWEIITSTVISTLTRHLITACMYCNRLISNNKATLFWTHRKKINVLLCTVHLPKHALTLIQFPSLSPSHSLPFSTPLSSNFPTNSSSFPPLFSWFLFSVLLHLLSSLPPACVPNCRSSHKLSLPISWKHWLAISWMWSSTMKTTGGLRWDRVDTCQTTSVKHHKTCILKTESHHFAKS